MLTRDEFRRASDEHRHRWLWLSMWIAVVLAMGGIGLAGILFEFPERPPDEPAPVGVEIVACVAMLCNFLILPLSLLWAVRRDRTMSRDERLRCPHCDARVGWHRRWVLQTGQCYRCLNQMIADPLPSKLRSRAEFTAAVARGEKQFPLVVGLYVLVGLLMIGFCGWALYALHRDATGVIRPLLAPLLCVMVPAQLVMLIGTWLLKNDLLNCPHCARRLDVKQIFRTNECCWCQRPVLIDDPLGVEPPPPGG